MIECSICKAHNEDRSLYCLECGQRLQAKVSDSANSDLNTASFSPAVKQDPHLSSSKLHSPILDMADQIGRKNKGTNMQFGRSEQVELSNGRSNGISRNGLHSPLLDGKNHFVNPYPDSNPEEAAKDSVNGNPDSLRLHSPVLDEPFSNSNNSDYIEEDFPTEEQEYESLRSPLLKAKVPLPKASHSDKLEAEQTIQSVLHSATGPLPKVSPTNTFATNKAAEAPLSITGINKLKNASTRQSMAEIFIDQKQAIRTSKSLLPADDEISPEQNNSSLNNQSVRILTMPLIFLALGFKVWYLISLGSAAYSSIPFILDQAGQIIVMILVLTLVLKVKN